MIKQPNGIIKLTNVALIKYKTKGKRLEIACYKNKAIDWRNGLETSLDEVLQSEEVFTNVYQGKLASKNLLQELFPNKTKDDIIKEILLKGEMQISAKEREALIETTFRDIINVISGKIIHPKSQRLFSAETVQKALKEINFNPKYNQNAKKQAQDAIKQLEKYYFIDRINILVKLVFKVISVLDELKLKFTFTVKQKNDNEVTIVINSKDFHPFKEYVNEDLKDSVEMHIIDDSYCNRDTKNIQENFELAMERRKNAKFPKNKAQRKESLKDETAEVKHELKNMSLQQSNKHNFGANSAKICNTCLKAEFPNLQLYKDHIRSDWHKYNLTRKMKKEEPLDAEMYFEYTLLQEMDN